MSPVVSSPACTSRRLATLVAALVVAVFTLSACGGEDRPSDPEEPETTVETDRPEPARGAEIKVAALGDSITAGSPLYDPDESIQERLGPALDKRSQYEYWAARNDSRLKFQNCGVFGERTDEIAERLDDCTDGADVLIVQGGINNIAQQYPIADAAEDLRGMVRKGKDKGLEVILVDVLPWNNGHPAADEPIAELNTRIAAIGEEENVPVLGFHDALENPDDPGTMVVELTIDGDHPSVAGYRILGRLVSDALR